MYSIKRYKKVAIVAPIVCLLGTGLTFVTKPTPAAAAVTTNYATANSMSDFQPISKYTLAGDLYERYQRMIIEHPDLVTSSGVKPLTKQSDIKYQEEAFAGLAQEIRDHKLDRTLEDNPEWLKLFGMDPFFNWVPEYTNLSNQNEIKLDNPRVDNYKEDNIELATYTNTTSSEQTFLTPSKTEKVTDSFTYSNSEGGKLGASATTTIRAGIPIAQAQETLTMSFEATYNHTSSNTSSTEKTVTYPSQSLKCLPGYKTSLIVKLSQANFSGTMSFEVEPTVDQLMDAIEKNWKYKNEKYKEKGDYTIPNRKEFLYNLYKYSNLPIPSYVKLDDKEKTVSFGKITSKYTGVAGHLSEASATEVKLEPLNKAKKPIIMPLKQYQQKIENHDSF
ncbi:ETX/MTX2 family pore-forming toxin [Bacillus tropicus]|uniref:ETX/MTX2 family pore-forming toxin n=1 Tax=Bacillus tropicus TaxID=2026188 RepID=UPI002685ED95|nr:ETX/MTX2 family pore-forming toxin [Bacillus tropicus]